MDCYGLTDTGRRRPTNQDHYLIADLNKSMQVHSTSLRVGNEAHIYGGSQGKLLLVADGMGGEIGGERASAIAVGQLTKYVLNSLGWCFRLEEDSEKDFEDDLKEALQYCQHGIRQVADREPELKRMGTTMTMVYIVWPRAFVVHVGDSRCYLLRQRQLNQITMDHTMGSILLQSGRATPDEAGHLPMRHVLWNALGGDSDDLAVDVYRLSLEPGDVLLLCTDGLYGMVSRDELQSILNSNVSAEAACRRLIDLANENGGEDNVTAIVTRFRQRHLLEAHVEDKAELDELCGSPAAIADTTIELKPLTMVGPEED